jgi:hypothetical protein
MRRLWRWAMYKLGRRPVYWSIRWTGVDPAGGRHVCIGYWFAPGATAEDRAVARAEAASEVKRVAGRCRLTWVR